MRCCTISVPIPCVRRTLGVGVCCLQTRLSTVSRHTCGLQICKHMSYSLAVHASLAATHARSKEGRTPVVVVSAMAGSSSPTQRWSMGCKCAAQGGCRGCCEGIIALPARQLYGDTHPMSASARYIPPVGCLLRLSGAEGFYKRALLHECQENVAGASLCRGILSTARARVVRRYMFDPGHNPEEQSICSSPVRMVDHTSASTCFRCECDTPSGSLVYGLRALAGLARSLPALQMVSDPWPCIYNGRKTVLIFIRSQPGKLWSGG